MIDVQGPQDLVAAVRIAIQKAGPPRAMVWSRQAKFVRCRQCGTGAYVTQDPEDSGDVWFVLPGSIYGEVECKFGPHAGLDKGQRHWRDICTSRGVNYLVAHARSKDDVPRVLEEVATWVRGLGGIGDRANAGSMGRGGDSETGGAEAGGGAAQEAQEDPHRGRHRKR